MFWRKVFKKNPKTFADCRGVLVFYAIENIKGHKLRPLTIEYW